MDSSLEAVPPPLQVAIRARIDAGLDVPLLPDVATRVLAQSQDDRCELDELAQLISHDQALAAHLLRLANSPIYAARAPILSIPQAIGRVGLAGVGQLAITVALEQRLFTIAGHEQRMSELWRHSSATAAYAREVAELLRADLEAAFLCGLLHDVGMPIALQLLCELEREGVAPRVTPQLAESVMMAFHVELGARLASSWKLGPWIDRVIRYHHDPGGARFHPREVPIVALADALAYWAVSGAEEREFAVDSAVLASLAPPPGALATLLRRRERVLQLVEAICGPVYA